MHLRACIGGRSIKKWQRGIVPHLATSTFVTVVAKLIQYHILKFEYTLILGDGSILVSMSTNGEHAESDVVNGSLDAVADMLAQIESGMEFLRIRRPERTRTR